MSYKNYIKRTLCVFSALVMVVSSSTGVSAFSDEDIFGLSDIPPFVNNEATYCSETDGGIVDDPSSSGNLETIYNFLLTKGLSAIQAAAITGNIAVESAGATNPLIVEIHPSANLPSSTDKPASLPIVGGWPGGQTRQPGWGLIQWTPASKFVTIAKALDIPEPHDLKAQLEVIWYHMVDTTPTGRTNFNAKFSSITDLEEATEVFMTDFLAPYAPSNHYEERLAAAQSALDQFGHNVPQVSLNNNGCFVGGSIGDPGATPGDSSGIVATALKYAWPTQTFKLQLKPEYKAAIDKAKANGENVNGYGRGGPSSLDGVDCHIYVKRVLRDSGADTSYSTDHSISTGMNYMSSSSKYEEYRPTSEEKLVPGTVIGYYVPGTAPGQPGRHILLYVGPNSYLQGGIKVAESSLPNYSPQAGWTDPMGGPFKNYHRYFRVVNAVDGAM